MVRPKASKCSKDIASEFAFAVTISSNNRGDLIARTGAFSIFSLLSRTAPTVIFHVVPFPFLKSNLTPLSFDILGLPCEQRSGFVQKWYIQRGAQQATGEVRIFTNSNPTSKSHEAIQSAFFSAIMHWLVLESESDFFWLCCSARLEHRCSTGGVGWIQMMYTIDDD